MKAKMIIAAVACFMLAAVNPSNLKADKQDRNADLFSKINIKGPVELILTQGSLQSLSVEADSDLINKITTNVKSKTLYVEVSGKNLDKKGRKIVVYVTIPSIDEVKATNAAKVTLQTPIHNAEGVEISLSGAATMKGVTVNAKSLSVALDGASSTSLTVDVTELKMKAAGASELKITGKAQKISATANGASNIDAYEFTYDKADTSSSGAASIRLSKN